jgi:hypothetical protein
MGLERRRIKFLTNESLDAHEILAKLQIHLQEKAYALPTIWFWMSEVQRGCEDVHDEDRSGRPPLDDIDATILRVLHKFSFELARSIAQIVNSKHSPVWHDLHKGPGFQSFHLR